MRVLICPSNLDIPQDQAKLLRPVDVAAGAAAGPDEMPGCGMPWKGGSKQPVKCRADCHREGSLAVPGMFGPNLFVRSEKATREAATVVSTKSPALPHSRSSIPMIVRFYRIEFTAPLADRRKRRARPSPAVTPGRRGLPTRGRTPRPQA